MAVSFFLSAYPVQNSVGTYSIPGWRGTIESRFRDKVIFWNFLPVFQGRNPEIRFGLLSNHMVMGEPVPNPIHGVSGSKKGYIIFVYANQLIAPETFLAPVGKRQFQARGGFTQKMAEREVINRNFGERDAIAKFRKRGQAGYCAAPAFVE